MVNIRWEVAKTEAATQRRARKYLEFPKEKSMTQSILIRTAGLKLGTLLKEDSLTGGLQ